MIQKLSALFLTACVAFAAAPARAEDRPPSLPTRDVTVDYVLESSGPMGPRPTLHLRFHVGAAARHFRLDVNDKAGFVLVEPANGSVFVVSPERKTAVLHAYRAADYATLMLNDGIQAIGHDNGTVDGLACRVWELHAGTMSGMACITTDGVILRSEGGDTDGDGDDYRYRLIARGVDYAPQTAGTFQIPSDFQQTDARKPAAPPG